MGKPETYIRGEWLRIEHQPDEKRREVRRQSPRIYEQIPKVVVDFVATRFQNGGWLIRRDHGRESRFVMDTILCHYVFIPGQERGRARVLVWPRMPKKQDSEYSQFQPAERYELEHA